MPADKPPSTLQIKFAKGRAPLHVEKGVNLMRALLDGGLPVASSCNGDGVCAKCRIKIIDGRENLSPETDIEALRRETHEIPRSERLSCQAEVLGDITIDTSYW